MFENRFTVEDVILGERGSANPGMQQASSVGQFEPMGINTALGGSTGLTMSGYVPPQDEGPTIAPPLMFGEGVNMQGRAPRDRPLTRSHTALSRRAREAR